jgi:hypothetical protein
MRHPAGPAISSTASAANAYARVDWEYPLEILTMSFVLMGVSALFRRLPLSAGKADILTMAVVFAWRYGVDRANIFPWDGRGSWTQSFLQAVLNAMACFAFFITVMLWLGRRPTSTEAMIPVLPVYASSYSTSALKLQLLFDLTARVLKFAFFEPASRCVLAFCVPRVQPRRWIFRLTTTKN